MHTGLLYILISLSISIYLSKRHATFLRITTANACLVLKLVPGSRLTILQPSQWGRYYYHLCFTDEKTEVLGRLHIYPSHTGWMDGARHQMQALCFQIYTSNHPCSFSSIRWPDPLSVSFFLIFFVDSPLSMVFPSFCGVGWRWGGMERLLACWDFCPLRNNKLFLYIPSSTPFSMELSLSDHSCIAKGKWSCLVFKQYGTHSNCCPGTEGLVSTLECFNWSLPHSLWVMLTSLNTLEWDIDLFFLPPFRSLEYDFQVHPTHSFLDTSDQLPFLYLSETIFHQNFQF